MSKETADILRKARAVIEKPENWTKGDFARDAKLRPISALSTDAQCFCTWGAIIRVSENAPQMNNAADALYRHLNHPMDLDVFNDDETTTHAEVLSLFDRAIAAEEAAQ